jgi:hypothetical protein
MARIIVFLLIRFKMRLYFIEATHRKSDSDKLASLFRINTFRGFGDGFISIFSSHVAKIRLYTENTICRLEILNDTFATNIRLMWHKGAVVSL